MNCEYCTHREVCKKVKDVKIVMIDMLINTFPNVNIRTARAATLYTLASLCPHYRTEEKAVSITIVSGD